MNHTAFPDKVASGEKRTSIRASRKRGEFKVGKPIYHYVGLRHKGARKILDAICETVQKIEISKNFKVLVDGVFLKNFEIENLAIVDGFENSEAFFNYFTLGRRKKLRKDFQGNLISWKPLKELWK